MGLDPKKAIPAALISILLSFGTGAGLSQEPPEPPHEIQTDSQITIPEGTLIPIVLTEYLNTRSTQVNDRFYAETAYPVWIQQRQIIPRGSMIRGTVTEVVRPGKVKGKGRLALRIDDVRLPNGVDRPLYAVFQGIHGPGNEKMDRKSETVQGSGSGSTDVQSIINPASTGAIIGAISGNGTGAGIGAGAGAAVGLISILLSRGPDLVLFPGTRFDIALRQPLKFSFGETNFTERELNRSTREYEQPANGQRGGQHTNDQRRHSGIGVPWFIPVP
jgi:hypothetical protein